MTLKPALISSFDLLQSLTTPNVNAEELPWPQSLNSQIYADIYIMMEPDVIAWNQKLGRNSDHESALEFFAEISPEQLTQVASAIYANAKAKQAPIPAITSFFPALSLPRDHVKRSHEALVANLLRLSLTIAKLQANDGHPLVPVVQMVAGSLISDIRSGEFDGKAGVFAESGEPADMFNTVLNQIQEALTTVSEEGEYPEEHLNALRIAFELEPGPIYLLSDIERVETLCNAIDDGSEAIQRCVGFNLDIPHWWLAENITPQWIQSEGELSRRVRKRIYHSHIAGHSERGHFGDMSLRRMPEKQTVIFKRWLEAIAEIETVQFVSLEIEAAKSFGEVQESMDTLLEWLSEIN